jgi:hypothetical protein
MGLPDNEQYIRGMALENATRLLAAPEVLDTILEDYSGTTQDVTLILADYFADYIKNGRTDKQPGVALRGRVWEPQVFKAGDRIQYKKCTEGPSKGVRLNGGLELTLEYLGSRYVIYSWASINQRDGEVVDSGEVQISREEFDTRIEHWTREE